MKPAIIEFLGTFFFVLAVATTANPLAIASMLMAWLYIGGYVSGGHFNPMVSFAVALRGGMHWHLVPRYMFSQILGGVFAFALASFLQGQVTIPAPGSDVTLLQAFVVEVLLSFVFALVVLNVTTGEHFKRSNIFGFAIGFTIPALARIGGPISGGLFNPAISVGGSIFGAFKGLPISWEHLTMYIGGALLGAFFAASAFKYLEDEK